jgi:hypothetical protein
LQVFCAAAPDDVAPAKTMKSKVWATVQSELKAQGRKPQYKQFNLQTKDGDCTIADLPDGSSIQ